MLAFLRRRSWVLVSTAVVMALALGGCGDDDDDDDMMGSAAAQYPQ
jgi:hypothetical protein